MQSIFFVFCLDVLLNFLETIKTSNEILSGQYHVNICRILLNIVPKTQVKELKVERKIKFCIEKNTVLTFKK